MRTTKASSSILCGSALERAPPLSRSIILNYPKKAVLTGVPIGAPRDAGMRQYRHNNQCLSFREAWPHSDADLTLIDNSPSRRPQHPSIVAGRRFSQSSIEIGRAHSELQSLMRISYAVFCLKKTITNQHIYTHVKDTYNNTGNTLY